MPVKKVVVLFSGEGNNLLHILQKVHGRHNIEIVAAITNKPEAKGIQKLKPYSIPCHLVQNNAYDSREAFDEALITRISCYKPDLVVLAGFMRILTPRFTQTIKAINLHPSLLPHFKGAKAIERSFEQKEFPAGVSVHWVSEELDGGEVIMQAPLERKQNESFEAFKNRIHLLEYELLPRCIIELLK